MLWIPQNKNHQSNKREILALINHQYGNACIGSLDPTLSNLKFSKIPLRQVGFKKIGSAERIF